MDGRETYGIILDVYRHGDTDCTAGGITSKANRVTLVGTVAAEPPAIGRLVTPMPRDSQVFGPREDAPPVALRRTNGRDGGVCLVPAIYDETFGQYRVVDSWVMMGGNYAATSDSRVSTLVDSVAGHRVYGALAVHDRIER